MKNLVSVDIVALKQTQAGCAVFLSDGKKIVVIFIDPAVGFSINAALNDEQIVRPLTHDLFIDSLTAFGAEMKYAVITRKEGDIFFAQLQIEAKNEIMERKIIQLDSRPSDCFALSVRNQAPLYVYRDLWISLEDQEPLFSRLQDEPDESFDFLKKD